MDKTEHTPLELILFEYRDGHETTEDTIIAMAKILAQRTKLEAAAPELLSHLCNVLPDLGHYASKCGPGTGQAAGRRPRGRCSRHLAPRLWAGSSPARRCHRQCWRAIRI